MIQKIDISTSTIFRSVLIVLGLVFIYLVRDVLLMVFIALIIAAAIDGPVDWMAKHRVRRTLGALMIYLFVAGLLAAFVYWALPLLAGQMKSLAVSLPDYLNKFGVNVSVFQYKFAPGYGQKILENLSSQIYGTTSGIFGTAVNIFGGIFSAIVIVVISFYLVVQDKGIKMFISSVTPAEHRPYVVNLAERIQTKLGRWMRGQLIIMLAIAVMVFAGLFSLRVDFALMLALLAGLLEIVPYIGPVLAGSAAVSLAFLQSPFLGFLVLILFLVVHQVEGYVLVPMVMKRAVGLNPLVVIISMIVGAKLMGILGVVVAVPIVAIISVFLGDIFLKEENEK
ncbi:MAG: AI-2E family transporter [Candidatus Portnoybacteria bacterium]|nr:AI-2E family transporter [Candidatus Portnoybacteria bacterium]MDD4982785.1 AI-2E family transporter [Candidatus Portnoybacteria bacterium]